MFIQNLSRKGKELEEVLLVRLYNCRVLKENCYSSLSLERLYQEFLLPICSWFFPTTRQFGKLQNSKGKFSLSNWHL